MLKFFMPLRCGQAVPGMRKLSGKTGDLSPTHSPTCAGLRKTTAVFPLQSRAVYPTISTPLYRQLPLLCATFSPLSTGPIKTTTKYIKYLGVVL